MHKTSLRLLLVITLNLLSGSCIFSQQETKENLEQAFTISDLSKIAKETDFNGNMASVIHRDNRNTYYAIRTNSLDSEYVKLSILEQVYKDTDIVHIGISGDENYIWFLVHNDRAINSTDIIKKLNKFYENAIKQMNTLTQEQEREWMLWQDKNK